MSTLLAQPDYARARPSTLLEKEQTYRKLFNAKTSLGCYFNAAYIGKLVSDTIKQEKKYSATEKTNIQFATVFYYVATLTGSTHITAKSIEKIDISNLNTAEIIHCADIVQDIFNKLGGTDRVAKNNDFTNALIVSFEQERMEQAIEQ